LSLCNTSVTVSVTAVSVRDDDDVVVVDGWFYRHKPSVPPLSLEIG
jgi:hypothetical protein